MGKSVLTEIRQIATVFCTTCPFHDAQRLTVKTHVIIRENTGMISNPSTNTSCDCFRLKACKSQDCNIYMIEQG